jgi:hypothetical protein
LRSRGHGGKIRSVVSRIRAGILLAAVGAVVAGALVAWKLVGHEKSSSREEAMRQALAQLAEYKPGRENEPTTARGCGVSRLKVKTLEDGFVPPTRPTRTRIGALISEPSPLRPSRLHQPRYPPERQLFTVRAWLKTETIDPDSDIHLVLKQDRATPMIAEVPDPRCAPGAPTLYRRAWARIRTYLRRVTCLKEKGWTKVGAWATVTGVRYYDTRGYEIGEAANGVELHPVTAVRVDRRPC